MKRRPNPIPHDQVGPYGHEWWVWAAKWAPVWLMELPDPEAKFTALNQTISEAIDQLANQHLQRGQDDTTRDSIWDAADRTVRQRVRAELMPAPEVTVEAWDDLDPALDPSIDGPAPDWTNPLAPTIDDEDS